MMKPLLLALSLAALMPGCVSEPKLTHEQWSAIETREVDGPRDQVLRAASAVILDRGYFYLASDHSAGIVTGQLIDPSAENVYRRHGGMRGPVLANTISVWVAPSGPTTSQVRVQHTHLGVRIADEQLTSEFWVQVQRRLLASTPPADLAGEAATRAGALR